MNTAADAPICPLPGMSRLIPLLRSASQISTENVIPAIKNVNGSRPVVSIRFVAKLFNVFSPFIPSFYNLLLLKHVYGRGFWFVGRYLEPGFLDRFYFCFFPDLVLSFVVGTEESVSWLGFLHYLPCHT